MRRTYSGRGKTGGRLKTSWSLIATALCLAAAPVFARELPRASASPAASSEAPIQRELLVSIRDRTMALIENGEVLKIYSVAVGTLHTPSPHGRFRIINRISNPTYSHSGVVIGPGRNNPLGNRWMGLDLKGYGIHGTNEPKSIGHAASHGCIRMRKRDVEELYRRVRVGDRVEIVDSSSAEHAVVSHAGLVTEAAVKDSAHVKTVSLRRAADKAAEF